MKCKSCFAIVGVSLLAVTGSFALANSQDRGQDRNPPQEFELPPGWTEADMQACMEAATPGEMHAYLAEGVGVWEGESTMWMAPGAEPMESECTSTITSLLDGRYFKCEMEGDMAGTPFNGIGIYAFDNVAQQFQSTWIDNCSTGIAVGKGERSYDGSTITWKYTYNCPVTEKPTTLREVETITGENTRTLTIFGVDPKSGKEYKMMEIDFTRTSGGARATGGR